MANSPFLHEKDFFIQYNAYGDIIRTETYVAGEEYAKGKIIVVLESYLVYLRVKNIRKVRRLKKRCTIRKRTL